MEKKYSIDCLSLREKVELCSGKDEWFTKDFSQKGIPSVMMSDGPNGLRKQEHGGDMLGVGASKPATCFPTAGIAACSFDEELLEKYGRALGNEAASENIAMVLGPGVCIKRNPLCGRNFEYFSEDPYLSGKLGGAYIRGMQSTNTAACIKHFACNSQEYFRMTSDSLVDERTMREIYLRSFEIAIKESHPKAVMGAYNKINGTYCCSSSELLRDILRDEWGFDGLVITDWTAVEDRTDSFLAGCDLVMPGGNGYHEREAIDNVKSGVLPEDAVDESAQRVADLVAWCSENKDDERSCDLFENHEIAREIAHKSAVLLKNRDAVLPLDSFDNSVFAGRMAENFRYQGYGSSKINPARIEQIIELRPQVPYAPGYNDDGTTDDQLINEAVSLSMKAETVIIFAGLPGIYESEGYDRENMRLPDGHNRLISEIVKTGKKTVVVLLGGAVAELPWADDVDAILYMGLSGQAGAGAALNILSGIVNPSGKLAETWPLRYEDVVSSDYYVKGNRDAQYREGIYVGYRYYEKADLPVRYPFGYGLSYTEFEYGSPVYDSDRMELSLDVSNIGARSGGEISLIYVKNPDNSGYRAVRELRGFVKTYLEPGESKRITFRLTDRDFSVWDNGWKKAAGNYRIEVVGNAAKRCCSIDVAIEGAQIEYNLPKWYLAPEGKPSESDFRGLYHKDISQTVIKPYTVNSNIADMLGDSFIIRRIYRLYERTIAKQYGRGTVDYKGMMIMADECPLRSVQNNLLLKNHVAEALADLGNGKYLSMLKHLLR